MMSDSSSNNDNGRKKRTPDELLMSSITDMATHLQILLQSKEKELAEREADFDRRVNLYEADHPSMGDDNDWLHLNVGGNCSIAVMRRTLTQFEDSVLAAQFSGRWDDSMVKDRDGNICIDQDPEQFLLLINYLRLRTNNQSKHVPEKHLPEPTYSFCYMLEYYGLMPAVYPQRWIGKHDTFSSDEISYGTFLLSSTNSTGDGDADTARVLYDFGGFIDAGVSEFTVEFEKGTSGAVGWYSCAFKGKDSVVTHTLDVCVPNSLILNIKDRKIFGAEDVLAENMKIDYMESATKVLCRHDGNKQYSIALMDDSSTGEVVETSLVKINGSHRVLPMVSFTGKVTVSGLKYAIDEL